MSALSNGRYQAPEPPLSVIASDVPAGMTLQAYRVSRRELERAEHLYADVQKRMAADPNDPYLGPCSDPHEIDCGNPVYAGEHGAERMVCEVCA